MFSLLAICGAQDICTISDYVIYVQKLLYTDTHTHLEWASFPFSVLPFDAHPPEYGCTCEYLQPHSYKYINMYIERKINVKYCHIRGIVRFARTR